MWSEFSGTMQRAEKYAEKAGLSMFACTAEDTTKGRSIGKPGHPRFTTGARGEIINIILHPDEPLINRNEVV